ncbi:enoyl-CoA hydratase-related protein [Pseudooceanicola sp.]|uniref:enoyl-CoA hydratase-related protein n=1 Tax=Pseudooceanicola sp. TaxID=1914328 RepID=UPI0026104AC6|nr:enoyl-CoA hydratase-related protein [Pseudooceanicola sp.]MDF1857124.1 enoyl-CoA hydratase-related protein [Pseudooceanicola sp.]
MTYEFCKVDRDGPILIVTMNRPEVYNACHAPMHVEMAQIWDDFAADHDLWVAVLTGAGDKAFSAGNDLKYTAKGGKGNPSPTGFAGLSMRFDLEKPIVAAVNGFAMGGGFETALSCDIILAADTAKFALPEVRVGLFAGAGGVQRLSRQIGRKPAVEMMLTGRSVGAAEGQALGFVNEVVPQAKLMERALEKARELTTVSPSSVRATKRVLNAMDDLENLRSSLNFSRQVSMDLRQTEDFREGVTAFVEKRKPQWKNG